MVVVVRLAASRSKMPRRRRILKTVGYPLLPVAVLLETMEGKDDGGGGAASAESQLVLVTGALRRRSSSVPPLLNSYKRRRSHHHTQQQWCRNELRIGSCWCCSSQGRRFPSIVRRLLVRPRRLQFCKAKIFQTQGSGSKARLVALSRNKHAAGESFDICRPSADDEYSVVEVSVLGQTRRTGQIVYRGGGALSSIYFGDVAFGSSVCPTPQPFGGLRKLLHHHHAPPHHPPQGGIPCGSTRWCLRFASPAASLPTNLP